MIYKMKKNKTVQNLPLYTMYVAGYPCEEVFFYERAAAELKINLKVEYHGCCIDSFVDENGKETSDAKVNSEKFEDQNIIAKQYYDNIHGVNWLDQVNKLSKHLILVDQYTHLKRKIKKEVKSKIYATIFLNIILFFSLWAIFNIYIGLIACLIFSLIRYFLYSKKYNKETDALDDLKFTIDNSKKIGF